MKKKFIISSIIILTLIYVVLSSISIAQTNNIIGMGTATGTFKVIPDTSGKTTLTSCTETCNNDAGCNCPSGCNTDGSIIKGATCGGIKINPNTGIIKGKVKEQGTNLFLQNVDVSISAAGISAKTGADGSYTLSNVPIGSQTITAKEQNHLDATAFVTVTAGQEVIASDIIMPIKTQPDVGNIPVRVVDKDGNGIIGAAVIANGKEKTTADSGIIVLDSIPVGQIKRMWIK